MILEKAMEKLNSGEAAPLNCLLLCQGSLNLHVLTLPPFSHGT